MWGESREQRRNSILCADILPHRLKSVPLKPRLGVVDAVKAGAGLPQSKNSSV